MKKELAAVIVENRPLPNLIEIIKDHLSLLPDYTKLYVFGGIAVEQMLIDANIECKFIEINRVINEAEYNRLLTSVSFWECIDEENILIFQHDSMLLRKGIEDFYEWDYVGAPIYNIPFPCMNGGLSFRHRSSMMAITSGMKMLGQTYNQANHGNEDIFFCNKMNVYAGLPLRETADQFSCESIFKLGTLGCHAIEKHLSKEQCEEILNQYKK